MKLILPSMLLSSCLCFSQTWKNLDTNMVSTPIGTCSIKHAGPNNTQGYQVPKASGKYAIFASSLWIGGFDEGNVLHVSGETYRQQGSDYSPGPLDTISASTTNSSTAGFNKVWKLSCNQINQFVTNANNNNFNANLSPTFSDINTYIANGNNQNNFASKLAPFYDANNNGIYEPSIGEYPIIKGHQQIYSVYNDKYLPHTETGGNPLGVEVHEKSYAFHLPNIVDSMNVINYTTFYNYEVINRSNTNYNNVYMTIWSDADLGYYLNDYIGTDTLNEFAYVYNGTASDPNYSGLSGYGNKHPMLAYVLLPQKSNQSDGVDNNNNGQTDETNERFKLNLTTFYNNNIGPFPPATTNPATALHYYNFMKGFWKDGSPFMNAGSAYNQTLNATPTKYVYTGNPQNNSGWTESTASVTPGDRRILCTIGPFNFPSKKKVEFEYAYVFSRDTTLNNVNANFQLLQKDVKNIKYFASQQNNSCLPSLVAGIHTNNPNSISFNTYPNPTSTILHLELNEEAEGYHYSIFNLIGEEVKKGDLVLSSTNDIDVESLPPAIYLLKLSNKYKSTTIKLMKE